MDTIYTTTYKNAILEAMKHTTPSFTPTIYARNDSSAQYGTRYAVASQPAPELDGDEWEELPEDQQPDPWRP